MAKGLSIGICSYNGAQRINKALDALLEVHLAFDWELIIVDNNSSDNLKEAVHSYANHLPLKFVHESKQGLIHARWKVVEEAKFDLILFCDDDNSLNQNYLEKGFNFFEKSPLVGVLAGKGEAVFESSRPSWFDRHQNFYAVGTLGRNNGKQGEGDLVYGAGLFFRKNALDDLKKLGFQNLSLGRTGNSLSGGEDLELTWGVMNLGYEYWYDDRLVFYHFIEVHRLTWKYYLSLSKAIASSYPLIESYKVLKFENVSDLKRSLLRIQLGLIHRMIVLALKCIKYRKRVYSSQLRYHWFQFLAFFGNYRATIQNFKEMKFSIFSNLKK